MAEAPAGPAPVTADALFAQLVTNIRRSGAFVSSKLTRSALPPAYIPGMVARSQISHLELLLHVPASVQFSPAYVEAVAPQLAAAVRGAASSAGRLLQMEMPEVHAFIASELNRISDFGPDAWCKATWFECLLGVAQRSSDNCAASRLHGDEEARQLLLPSPEVHTAAQKIAALHTTRRDILVTLQKDLVCDIDRFIQAHHLLYTRAFGRLSPGSNTIEYCLVPVADMINHSTKPNATWDFNDSGDFYLKACDDIDVGSEIFISYGDDKSNPRLFGTHGFTVPPHLEPRWSFRVWAAQAAEVFEEFMLFPALQTSVLDLDSQKVHETTNRALRFCLDCEQDPAAFLRSLCTFFLAKHAEDPLLQPILARLAKRRAEAPDSADWWTEWEEDKLQAVPGLVESSASTTAAQDAVRVKMSEYLCLTAHIEALDIEAGVTELQKCLREACSLGAQWHWQGAWLALSKNSLSAFISVFCEHSYKTDSFHLVLSLQAL